jgi:hypothetical protein
MGQTGENGPLSAVRVRWLGGQKGTIATPCMGMRHHLRTMETYLSAAVVRRGRSKWCIVNNTFLPTFMSFHFAHFDSVIFFYICSIKKMIFLPKVGSARVFLSA